MTAISHPAKRKLARAAGGRVVAFAKDTSSMPSPRKPPLAPPPGARPPHPPSPGQLSPLLTACDLVPLGDGSFRAVPRRPAGKVTVKEAAKLANYPLTSIYRLYNGGFIDGERQSPRRILIDLGSLRAHLDTVREDADYWNDERRDRYWNGAIK